MQNHIPHNKRLLLGLCIIMRTLLRAGLSVIVLKFIVKGNLLQKWCFDGLMAVVMVSRFCPQ